MRLFTNKKKAARFCTKVFDDMGWSWFDNPKPQYGDILARLDELESNMKNESISISRGRLIVLRIDGIDDRVFYGINPMDYEEWINHLEGLA